MNEQQVEAAKDRLHDLQRLREALQHRLASADAEIAELQERIADVELHNTGM